METRDLLRHQIINSLLAQHTEKVADAAINLWEQMATQIISIVGEGGFDSLYARSVFLTRSTFPWIAAGALPPQADQRFTGLKMSLEGQTLFSEKINPFGSWLYESFHQKVEW